MGLQLAPGLQLTSLPRGAMGLILIVGGLLLTPGALADASLDKVYWTSADTGTIKRANLDGTDVETLVSGLDSPKDITLDLANGKMYWTARNTIQRANLDGTGIDNLVSVSDPRALALDARAGKLYWINGMGNVRRADLDGTDVETLFSPGAGSHLAIDADTQKVYYDQTVITELGHEAQIRRANLDGTRIDKLWVTDQSVTALTLDPSHGKMYWGVDFGTERVADDIRRAELDGSGEETLISVSSVGSIAVNPARGEMYWSADEGIQRANWDGTDVETLVGRQGGSIALQVRPPAFRVERSTGNVFILGRFNANGADLAERISVSESVEPGDVISIDRNNTERYRKAQQAHSELVAGVIASDPGVVLGADGDPPSEPMLGLAGPLWLAPTVTVSSTVNFTVAAPMPGLAVMNETTRPVMALMGRVEAKATTANGPIRPGDLLVSAARPGHVMKCAQPEACRGAIVGKALEPLREGQGTIRMLVMP